MLQAIRSKAGSFVVKALFALLIATFGIWGIGDIFRNRTPDTTVATVGDHSIDANALQTALQPALQRLSAQLGTAVDLRQAKQMGVIDDVLAQLINQSLIDQEAARLQLDVSDDVVRNDIIADPMFKGPNGVFDRGAFNALLASNHMTEGQYAEQMRQDIPRRDLVRAVAAEVVAPQVMVDRIYRYRNEKRIADIVALPDAGAGDVGQPTGAELTKFYDAHPDLFRAPEYRAFTIASLTPSDLARTIKIPEDRLRKEYDQRQDEFVLPERRDVQQILAPSESQAKAAVAALAAGKDWKEVATTIAGQDPSTIDLGLMARAEMPQTLAEVAFSLPLDKPGAPVKSPLGWHILRVVKIEPAKTQTFDEAKTKLRADIAHDEAADNLYKVADHVDDELAGGADLDAAAAKFGLQKTVVAAVDEHGNDRDGKTVTLPVSPAEVLKLAVATDENRTSRVTQTPDGAIFVLHTTKVIPPSVRPLAEVKDKAIAAWQAEKRRDAVAKEAKALAAAVKPGTQLSAVAAAQGLKVATSPPLLRRAESVDGVPPALVAKLFAVKPGAAVTGADAAGSYVAQLTAVQLPPTSSKTTTAELSREIGAGLQADLGEEFTRALRARFPVEIQRDTLDRLF
jgi:peptidyl-prolyl cis-trans isomerase D